MDPNRLHIFVAVALVLVMLFIGSLCGPTAALDFPQARSSAEDSAFEASQTAKLLGVPVQNFPAPQGLTDFDELPANARPFKFTLTSQAQSGPPPRLWYETREIVEARAPDGSVYEAFCGRDDPYEITPGHGYVSSFENRRQHYGTHHGYGYQPDDVFIGKREAGLITPTLFFRDVGSHTTAPHYLAIDSQGMVHLAVADVNIFQDNRLDLYWMIGDPKTRKWTAAWLIDRRGFTSASHPWSAAWSDKVHLIWNWYDASRNKRAPGMGAFHLEWAPAGFGRKTRVFHGPLSQLDAAVDQQSGLLVVVLCRDAGGVYVLSRSANGKWTRPSLLHSSLRGRFDISIEAAGNGAFIIRTGSEDTKEWLLRPQP